MYRLSPPIVFVDTEYTTFGPTRETGWLKPGQHKEIFQLAAVRIDGPRWEESGSHETIVLPSINPNLSAHALKLTGLSQERINSEGLPWAAAIKRFEDFARGANIATMDQDWFVMQENCKLNQIDFPFAGEQFIRIAELLSRWGVNRSEHSSGTLYKAAGIEMDGHVHNALHDVRSMSQAVAVFLAKERGISR